MKGSKLDFQEVTSQSLEYSKLAFCPFSLGTRGCIGKNMAYMEMLTAIARLMWTYDMRFSMGEVSGGGDAAAVDFGRQRPDEYQLTDRFVCEREGPVAQFKMREVASVVA